MLLFGGFIFEDCHITKWARHKGIEIHHPNDAVLDFNLHYIEKNLPAPFVPVEYKGECVSMWVTQIKQVEGQSRHKFKRLEPGRREYAGKKWLEDDVGFSNLLWVTVADPYGDEVSGCLL